ncbi:TKL protein kinase, variant [Aphanomyces astaci]|uniref:TKL protein kinase, variant n=1 Tax=Aphanomyces astaci TaxID=112090 RepID=W4GD10_APHAT|nr:TKL protein kinase, variant [Aphanomyces astaci]ETV77156.1 TKL protein kinase, variant [Aphanomyces astaci]|eukprot:XP_009833462.1 TKL protein kinase, variant [Aphanomyces astaci]
MSTESNRSASPAPTAVMKITTPAPPSSSCPYMDAKGGSSILVSDPSVCATTAAASCEVSRMTCEVLRSFSADVTGFINITAVGNMANYKNSYLALTNAATLDLGQFQVPEAVEYLNIENITALDLSQLPTPLPPTVTTLRIVNCNLKAIPSSFSWPSNLNRVGLDSNQLDAIPPNLPAGIQLLAFRHNYLSDFKSLPPGLGGINAINNSIQALTSLDLRDLTYLELGRNPLTTVAFVQLSKSRLTYFGLSNMMVVVSNITLDTSSFQALRNLPRFHLVNGKPYGYRVSNTTVTVNRTACQLLHGTVKYPWAHGNAGDFPVCVVPNNVYHGLPWSGTSLLWVGCIMVGTVLVVLAWMGQKSSQRRRRRRGYFPLHHPNPQPPVVLSKLRPFQLASADVIKTSKYPVIVAHNNEYHMDIWSGTFHGTKVSIKSIKMAAESPDSTDAQITAFIDQVTLLATLRHAHLVAFIGVSWAQNAVADFELVVEFMDTGDLRAFLATHSPATYLWPEKCDVVRGILHGLAYLHTIPHVHGHLKSKNVLLDSKKGTKLAVLGVKPVDFAASAMWFQWAAPERLAGQPVDTAADVYSFGTWRKSIYIFFCVYCFG